MSKELPKIKLNGQALDNALKVKSEMVRKGKEQSSWNVVINKICREYGQTQQNTINKTSEGVEFKLSGYIPDESVCKHKAKQVMIEMIELLFKTKDNG